MNTVEMEQQQPVYVEQPQTVHETAAMADPSETSALLLLIFGTIICPILCCVNACVYSKYLAVDPHNKTSSRVCPVENHANPITRKYAKVSLILAILFTIALTAFLLVMVILTSKAIRDGAWET